MRCRSAHTRKAMLVAILPAVALVCGASPAVAQQVTAESPAPAGSLDLRQCVMIALDADLSLAISQEQRSQANQDLKAAWGAFLPDLTLSRVDVKDERTDFDVEQSDVQMLSVQTIEGPILTFPIQTPTGETANEDIKTSYDDYNVQSNWNLFAGFSKISGYKSARSNLQSAEAMEQYNREVVAQNVASAYYDLLRYERLLEVALETRDLAAKELERSETYFRLGSVAKSDVLQARVRLENTRLDVVRAENAVAQAFADLAYAMGQPLAQRVDIDRSPLEPDFALEDLGSLYSEAMQNRLDLKSQEYAVAASKNDITTAGGNLWPRIDLFASYRRQRNESPFRFGAQESDNLRYGYQVTWNVFDRMTTLTNRSKAKASRRIAEYTLEQYRPDVQREIRQLYNNLIEARESASVSRETIIQSQEELRLAQERFRVGAGTSLDRIVAEVNLANSRAQEVQAICDFLIGRVQLIRAVGRFSQLLEEAS